MHLASCILVTPYTCRMLWRTPKERGTPYCKHPYGVCDILPPSQVLTVATNLIAMATLRLNPDNVAES